MQGEVKTGTDALGGDAADGVARHGVGHALQAMRAIVVRELLKFARTGAALEDARRSSRRVRFDGADCDCPVYRRGQLDIGSTLAGPAILEQLDCTTVIRPGQVARVDEWKNLIVTQKS